MHSKMLFGNLVVFFFKALKKEVLGECFLGLSGCIFPAPGLLVLVSSTHARRGELHTWYPSCYGQGRFGMFE